MFNKEKVYAYSKKIADSKIRILTRYGFFGLLLTRMTFSLDMNEETVSTDGRKIYFNPQFLEALSDDELDFVLLHEIMHLALEHCWRGEDYDRELFDRACDIVVNSNIVHELEIDATKLRIAWKEVEYLTPGGFEGYLFSAEDVYIMFRQCSGKKSERDGKNDKTFSDDHTRWNDSENNAEKDGESDGTSDLSNKQQKKHTFNSNILR